jgi:DNA-binding FadR family transcriptional regulator
VSAERAFEQLAGRLREQILAGELPEGARLPSEVALAEDAGVSRSTVREALRTLQERGYVERASPRVMVVRSHGGDTASGAITQDLLRRSVTFGHLLEALLAVEPELSRLAATRAGPDGLERLRAILDAQAAATDDYDAWNELDEAFHLEIADLAANPALRLARGAITPLLVPTTKRFVRARGMTRAATDFHERILAEIAGADPEGAAVMTRAHINDFKRAWSRAGLDMDIVVAEP